MSAKENTCKREMPSLPTPQEDRQRAFENFYDSYLFGEAQDAGAQHQSHELDAEALFARCEATFQQQAESGCFEKLFGKNPTAPQPRAAKERKRTFADARIKRKFFADLQKRDNVPVDVSLSNHLRRIADYAKQMNMGSGARMRSLYERLCDGDYSDQHSECSGDVKLARILEVFTQFGEGEDRFTLRVDQQVMLSYSLGATLQMLYGDDLEANRERLLQKLGLDRFVSDIILYAPRRVGKTTFVASFLAAFLIAIPKIEIACMSLYMRMAHKMKDLTIEFMESHKVGRHLVGKAEISSADTFVCHGEHHSHKKTLRVLPDNPNVRILLFFFLPDVCRQARQRFVFFSFAILDRAEEARYTFDRDFEARRNSSFDNLFSLRWKFVMLERRFRLVKKDFKAISCKIKHISRRPLEFGMAADSEYHLSVDLNERLEVSLKEKREGKMRYVLNYRGQTFPRTPCGIGARMEGCYCYMWVLMQDEKKTWVFSEVKFICEEDGQDKVFEKIRAWSEHNNGDATGEKYQLLSGESFVAAYNSCLGCNAEYHHVFDELDFIKLVSRRNSKEHFAFVVIKKDFSVTTSPYTPFEFSLEQQDDNSSPFQADPVLNPFDLASRSTNHGFASSRADATYD